MISVLVGLLGSSALPLSFSKAQAMLDKLFRM